MSATLLAAKEFNGFLDGFQARNLASVERAVDRYLSEFQTWLSVMRSRLDMSLPGDLEVAKMLDEIDAPFRSRDGKAIEQTERATKSLTELVITHGALIRSRDPLVQASKGLIRSLIEAAEVSRSDRMIRPVLDLVENYKRTIGG